MKSYHEALRQYHLHPKAKFPNGNYTDQGFTRRRHIRATVTEYVGKEANRWEEQLHLGLDLEAQTEYGLSPEGRGRVLETAKRVVDTHGQRQSAAAAGISLSELSTVLLGRRRPSPSTLTKACMAISRLQRAESEEAERTDSVLEEVRRCCKPVSLQHLARQAGEDPANLNRALKVLGS